MDNFTLVLYRFLCIIISVNINERVAMELNYIGSVEEIRQFLIEAGEDPEDHDLQKLADEGF